MARIHFESYDQARHTNHMPEVDEGDGAQGRVLVVEVGRYRLEFLSRRQLEVALEHFVSPSGTTRHDASGGDHWEFQPWQSRLPKGIVNRHHRPKVLAALRRGLEMWEAD